MTSDKRWAEVYLQFGASSTSNKIIVIVIVIVIDIDIDIDIDTCCCCCCCCCYYYKALRRRPGRPPVAGLRIAMECSPYKDSL